VLHEYLGIMGIDDSGYALSGKLYEYLQATARPELPLYSCVLIKDPKMKPQYLDSNRVGGNGESDIAGLGAEKIRVQLYVSGGSMGTDVLITVWDGETQVGMLELPHVAAFPPTIDLYSADRTGMLWQVHCAR
jgi:hypothetical protein